METGLIFFTFLHPSPYLVCTEGIGRVAKNSEYFIWQIVSLEFLAKYSVNVKTMKSFLSSLARSSYGAGHKIFMHVIIGSGPCLRIRDPFSNEYLPPVFQISSNSGPICGGLRYY